MAFQRGEVVLVSFPYSDFSTAKARPAIVISSAAYHQTEPDLLLAVITFNLDAATGRFDYPLQHWKEAGLRFPSALKPVLFTLDPQRVIHSIGVLQPADLVEIDQLSKVSTGSTVTLTYAICVPSPASARVIGCSTRPSAKITFCTPSAIASTAPMIFFFMRPSA
jgi:mRNA interferase MazF